MFFRTSRIKKRFLKCYYLFKSYANVKWSLENVWIVTNVGIQRDVIGKKNYSHDFHLVKINQYYRFLSTPWIKQILKCPSSIYVSQSVTSTMIQLNQLNSTYFSNGSWLCPLHNMNKFRTEMKWGLIKVAEDKTESYCPRRVLHFK